MVHDGNVDIQTWNDQRLIPIPIDASSLSVH
jgi:hypothetical protein